MKNNIETHEYWYKNRFQPVQNSNTIFDIRYPTGAEGNGSTGRRPLTHSLTIAHIHIVDRTYIHKHSCHIHTTTRVNKSK